MALHDVAEVQETRLPEFIDHRVHSESTADSLYDLHLLFV